MTFAKAVRASRIRLSALALDARARERLRPFDLLADVRKVAIEGVGTEAHQNTMERMPWIFVIRPPFEPLGPLMISSMASLYLLMSTDID